MVLPEYVFEFIFVIKELPLSWGRADSWEPRAEAMVLGSSFLLFVHQVTFFANCFAQRNPHPYLQQDYNLLKNAV